MLHSSSAVTLYIYLLNTYLPVVFDSEYILHSFSQPDLTESYKDFSEQNLKRLTVQPDTTSS